MDVEDILHHIETSARRLALRIINEGDTELIQSTLPGGWLITVAHGKQAELLASLIAKNTQGTPEISVVKAPKRPPSSGSPN